MANGSKKNTELAKTEPAGSMMERPAFLSKDDHRGSEHIAQEDLQLPRIAIAQGLSPELIEGNAKYIDGLKMGHMFNNLTGELYNKGPIEFVVVRADPPRWVEFIPRDEGGGVADLNVPPDDPRTQFTRDEEGKSVPPVATKFYDYVILMLPSKEPIALSMKGKALKVARQLNALIKLRNAPIFAGKYVLTSTLESNSKGTYGVPQIRNAGWVDEQLYKLAEGVYESIKSKNLVIDRDPGEDDMEFPTDEAPIEAATHTADM
jgi:hypothetical protein